MDDTMKYSEMPNSSDLIYRQAAIDALKGMAVPLYKDPACEDIWERDRTLDNAIDAIRGLPSAQPERIRGRWIEKLHVHGVAYCSLCDYELHTNDTNFCPNCGADMRGDTYE